MFLPEVLRENRMDGYTCPSRKYYRHQWLWDSCFHAIVLVRYDEERAKREMHTLLSAQWEEGMVPHMRFNPRVSKSYRPNASDWNVGRETSGITQPPLIATAVLEIYGETGDIGFVRSVYPAIVRYHEWLKTVRDPATTGLVHIVHPWESGMDNSPIYDGIRDGYLKAKRKSKVDRDDRLWKNAQERPTDRDYEFYNDLIALFQKLRWDQKKMAAKSPFWVADLLFNSIWLMATEDLAELAELLGKKSDRKRFSDWVAKGRKSLVKKCWNERDRFFYSVNSRTKEQIEIKTCAGLLPLSAKAANPRMAKSLIRQIQDPRRFGSERGVTSVSLDSPYFDPVRYWRGPVWINIQWLLARGLRLYGESALADRVAGRAKETVKSGGYWEYYQPFTGNGLGAARFSWSALGDILNREGKA